jgi:outer membrane protein assembly factor BamB
VALPAVIGDKILVAGTAYPADGCGAATCTPVWSADVPAPVLAQAGSPDGHIFLTAGEPVSTGGLITVYSVDPADGHVLWSVPQSAGVYYDGGVAVSDGFVYTLAGSSPVQLRVYPVDGCSAPTCDPTWSAHIPIDVAMAPPVVAGGVVYVKTEFRLSAFRAAGCGSSTCQPITYLTTTGGPTSVSDGKVFVSQRPYSGIPAVTAFSAG